MLHSFCTIGNLLFLMCALTEITYGAIFSRSWTSWSSCSKSCGEGSQSRTGDCKLCTSTTIESQRCNSHSCPVDGVWGQWHGFTQCSKTCGGGLQRRIRLCNQPTPAHGGKSCPGGSSSTHACNNIPCPVNGEWGAWSSFAVCSSTCGGGHKKRERFCNTPAPLYDGKPCSGPPTSTEICNSHRCPVDGGWSPWSPHSTCSTTCGEGAQGRYRICNTPTPAHGGDNCTGLHTSSRPCYIRPCPAPCMPSEKVASCELKALKKENITSENLSRVVNNTLEFLSGLNTTDATVNDVENVADIIGNILELDNISTKDAASILNIVDNLQKIPHDVIASAQNTSGSSNRILKDIDSLSSKITINKTTGHGRIVSDSIALEIWDVNVAGGNSSVMGMEFKSSNSSEEHGPLGAVTPDSPFAAAETDTAIFLQRPVSEQVFDHTNSSHVRLAMQLYNNPQLFRGAASSGTMLNSKVISLKILIDGHEVSNMTSNTVTAVFRHTIGTSNDTRREKTTCVYWSFSANEGSGGWETDGCRVKSIKNNRVVCECDHLTNFAVLLSYESQAAMSQDHQLALSIITGVGLTLSIAGLSFYVVSFILIKTLHRSMPQQVMFSLSLSLLMSWVTFVGGIMTDQTASKGACLFLAALLHYLILTSFMWMLVEAVLQYLMFVKVMNTRRSHFMKMTSVFAWGVPIIPVTVTLAVDYTLYDGGDKYCWMSQSAFYFAFMIPVAVIATVNLVLYIIIIATLWRRPKVTSSKGKSNQIVVNIRASFVCFWVLGLSWVFGFLAIRGAKEVFQYLFCILAPLQGFIMFIMMSARDERIKKYWFQRCFDIKNNKRQNNYSSFGKVSDLTESTHM